MSSEWLKVMLEEISRKKAEGEQARAEEILRGDERRRQGEPERNDEPKRTADPPRQAEPVHGDQPEQKPGSDVDRARG